jgi:hypothetical protein
MVAVQNSIAEHAGISSLSPVPFRDGICSVYTFQLSIESRSDYSLGAHVRTFDVAVWPDPDSVVERWLFKFDVINRRASPKLCCSVSQFSRINRWVVPCKRWLATSHPKSCRSVARGDNLMTSYRSGSMGGPLSKAFLLRQVTPVAYFD